VSEKLPSPYEVRPYMTVVPGRRPMAKAHTSIGHAKNALLTDGSKYNTVRGGELYEWRDGQWSLLYSVPPNSPESKIPWRRNNA
jgi:hypothetical protein